MLLTARPGQRRRAWPQESAKQRRLGGEIEVQPTGDCLMPADKVELAIWLLGEPRQTSRRLNRPVAPAVPPQLGAARTEPTVDCERPVHRLRPRAVGAAPRKCSQSTNELRLPAVGALDILTQIRQPAPYRVNAAAAADVLLGRHQHAVVLGQR